MNWMQQNGSPSNWNYSANSGLSFNPTVQQSNNFFSSTLQQSDPKSWLNNISSKNANNLVNTPSSVSVPNIKDTNNFQNVINQVQGTSKPGDWFRKMQGGLQKNFGVKLPTNVTGIGNLGVNVANAGLDLFGVKKAELTNTFDNVLSTVNSLPLGMIPGVGQALQLGVGAANLINQSFGQTTKKQGTDSDLVTTGRDFNYNTASNKKLGFSDRVKGWFGNNTYKRSNAISHYYDTRNLESARSAYLNNQNLLASNNTSSRISQNNATTLLGNLDDPYGNRMLVAKSGAKIEYMQSGNKFLNLIKTLTGKNEKINTLYDPSHGLDADCEECAKFQNEILRNSGYAVSGNAWNLNRVKDIFNAYDPEKRPSNYSRDSVEMYNQDAANRFLKEFDSNTLDTTKTYVANMYYNGSPYQEQAFNEGNNVAGTHTGYLRWKKSDGTNKGFWENVHNISGTVHVEPFVKTQGGNRKWGVTSLYEPEEKNIFDKTKDSFKNIQRIASKVKILKSGGKMNVIPDGAFHSRKHDLPENIAKEVTGKGIPVITKEDGEIVQHAEIERNEIIFHKELTNKLEELLKQYNSETNQKKKDEIAIKAGKLLKKEILYNTKDNTGLLEKVE